MKEIDRPDPQEIKDTSHTEWIVGSVEPITNETQNIKTLKRKKGHGA